MSEKPEPFYAVAITRNCNLWYLVREVRRIAARDQQGEIYGIIAGPVEGFLRQLGALEQK